MGCLKEKDLEIISKITNADGLKALAQKNSVAQRQSATASDSHLYESERSNNITAGRTAWNQRHTKNTSRKKQLQYNTTTQDSSRESFQTNNKDRQRMINQNTAEKTTLSPLGVNGPVYFNLFDNNVVNQSSMIRNSGIASQITTARQDYILNINMKHSQHD